ncbi:MAG TPA: AMP-binding protein [Terriglobales bacterium]|nr:AMP-binding protein [Terriglobales bacterium]
MATERNSITEYLETFRQLGAETAYVQRRGYRHQRWSYGDVAATAYRFARELDARGVAPGERVLIWGPNCAEWVAAFFGCAARGAVAVPMDRIAAPDFARRVAEQVDAKLAVAGREQAPLLVGANVPVVPLESLRDVVASRSAGPLAARAEPADTVEIVFTSGTTADPKGVVISHRNILANLVPFEGEIAKYRKWERWFHPIRFLNLLPLSHVFGQFLGIFIPQLIGGTVIFEENLNPGEVVRTVKRERVSAVVTVPRLLDALKDKLERDAQSQGRAEWLARNLEAADKEKFLWRWWRFRRIHRMFGWKFWAFISGGAALDAATAEFWRLLGYGAVQGYGLTETTSLISVQHPFKMGRRSIGKVLPGRELKLDEATGEILVRGENIASGYWQGRELKPVLGEEGWFRTGDLGALDAEGNLYFKGRRKNVIVTPEGLNVHPEDLEQALREQKEVRDAVVVGLARGGNAEPVAVLLLRDEAAADDVVKRANARLAEFQHMRRWYVWPEEDFPRTPTQKPRTNVIQDAVQRQLGAGGGAPAAAGTLAEIIARITRRPAGELNPDARLETDLGLNSIDRVELMSALEDRYQIDLDEAQFSAATTVRELEQVLHGASQAEAPAGEALRGAEPTEPARGYVFPRWAQRWPMTWIRPLVYYALTYPYTMIMARPRVTGRENLRGMKAPMLMVSNHLTYIDIGFLMAALPARYRTRLAVAMAGEQVRALRHPARGVGWFRRWLDRLDYWLVTGLFNVFPLPQQSGFRQSFAFAGDSVDRGYSVVVFPEGVRSRTGEMAAFRSGIGLLANRLGLPVLPMKIEGLHELAAAGKHWAKPGTVRVKIGVPVHFSPETDPGQIARELQRRVTAL